MIAYHPCNHLVQKAIFRPTTRKLTYYHYTDKFNIATNGTFCQLWSQFSPVGKYANKDTKTLSTLLLVYMNGSLPHCQNYTRHLAIFCKILPE